MQLGHQTAVAGDSRHTAPGSEPQSIPSRFDQVVARYGRRIAVSSNETEWTYEELSIRSQAVAWRILDYGGSVGDPVALLLDHGPLFIASILGALQAGRTYLGLDPAFPRTHLQAMVADSGARVLISDPANKPFAQTLCPENGRVFEAPDRVPGTPVRGALPPVSSDSGAWLMYTSGSTGTPKGVWQDHAGAAHHSDVYGDAVQLTADDRLSLLTPLSLAASTTHLFAALLHGAALCPFSIGSQGVARLAAWLRHRRITMYHSVPSVFRQFARLALDPGCFESLRLVRLGGESVMPPEVEIFRRHCSSTCRLMHSLSSTETGHIAAFFMAPDTPVPRGRLPVGKPFRDKEVTLVAPDQRPLDVGEPGRIRVRSAFLARGYWRQPEASRAEFLSDPAAPRMRTFLTADLGRWLPDGNLEYLGRVDQLVKISGRRVRLADIEAAMLATEFVTEAVVTAVPRDRETVRLVAYFSARKGKRICAQDLRRRLSGALPVHMIPETCVALDRLPRGPGGKLDRNALPMPPERVHRREATRTPPFRGRVEEKLAEVWKLVLGVSEIHRKDDFFDLGGSSLQAVDLVSRIDDLFGTALPPSALADHSTIEQLAQLVSARSVLPASSPLVTLRPALDGQPLFFIHTGQGTVVSYALLARRLSARPIYGFQSVGMRGESWPLMTIPAMARRYLPEIQARAPTGPVLLAATCMGGLVALELAKLLLRGGREVGLLALIDTHYPCRSWQQPRWRDRVYVPCRDAVRSAFRILRWRVVRAVGLGQDARWLPGFRRFVSHMNSRSYHRYRPGFYPGRLIHFLTTESDCPERDRRALMQQCAREVRNIAIPGKRINLFAPPALDILAKALQAELENIDVRRGSGF